VGWSLDVYWNLKNKIKIKFRGLMGVGDKIGDKIGKKEAKNRPENCVFGGAR